MFFLALNLVYRERDGEGQRVGGRREAKGKHLCFNSPSSLSLLFLSCCRDCVYISTVTNKEVQIKNTIFRTTLCLLV